MDPAGYNSSQAVVLEYDKNFTENMPSVEELTQKYKLSVLSVQWDPKPNQLRENRSWLPKPSLKTS